MRAQITQLTVTCLVALGLFATAPLAATRSDDGATTARTEAATDQNPTATPTLLAQGRCYNGRCY